MITGVDIANFKGLTRFSVSDLPGNIVLAGPNNSGKTTFLQAIALWCAVCKRWLGDREGAPARGPDGNYGTVLFHRSFANSAQVSRFPMLWTNGQVDDPVVVRLHTDRWIVGFEIVFRDADTARVRPDKDTAASELEELADHPLRAAYIGPFSGLREREDGLHEDAVTGHLLQGSAGRILRNVLGSVSLQEKKWKHLGRLMDHWFGYQLTQPTVGATAYAAYRHSKHAPELDLDNGASGFLQTLTVFASILRNEHSVVLLDEPDAHLHVLLQDKMHDALAELCRNQGSQLMIATHSRVMIDQSDLPSLRIMTADRTGMRSVPDRKTAIGTLRVSNAEVVLCATEPGILFLEGSTDLHILRGWARALNHPARQFLERPFWLPTAEEDKKATFSRSRFDALRPIAPERFRALELCDLNDKKGVDTSVQGEELMPGLVRMRWSRKEIENFFLHEDFLVRFHEERYGPESGEKARTYIANSWPPPMRGNPFANEGIVQEVGGKREVNAVLQAAGADLGTNLGPLAEAMTPEEIHPEVKGRLDRIAEHLNL